MKKLLLFLLIFALFLVGCQPAETSPENNETPNGDQTENQPSDPSDDIDDTQTPSDATDNTTPPEKTPATQITNKGELQDENDDFLFVFWGKEGYFARGERMALEVDLINNTGATHTYNGQISYHARVKLFCITNGEEYVLEHEEVPGTADSGTYYDIESGASASLIYYYNIPIDAPAGEYTLVCWYKTTRTEFEGYFTLE